MAKKDSKNGGIARIYTADTHSHIIFGAVHFARIAQPDRPFGEIVAHVLKVFAIEMTTEAATRLYYRVEELYLQNGGI